MPRNAKNPAVAIVGMACRYPDADSPQQLWENVLAQRRAFRRLPEGRTNPADYWDPTRFDPDATYADQAAVLEGYVFDRVQYRVSGSTYRSVDPAHWLALDTASRALDDAGFPSAAGLPRDMTGVLIGNTLTGEFSRAGAMRLRWPFVERMLDAELENEGWDAEKRNAFLERFETAYKKPFPEVGTETLAGSLSNTIAGRICNFFDLHGGGYAVDGACAASLLAVIHAAEMVAAGDLEIALAGGVDLSLDPFELVGFARVGALAQSMMRVYDQRSEGFWPGEGCGFIVLMDYDRAVAEGRNVYAVIRGWGISSDGSGGITRPEVDGQMLAVQRAWARSGFAPETAGYFEGHGTGTSVGDAVELEVLSRIRRTSTGNGIPRAAIGSIKANIGHTKAAAGLAGLLKATLALHHEVLPAATACDRPHEILQQPDATLRVLPAAELWPEDVPLRVGVSAMGFGGINTHVVLDRPAASREKVLTEDERTLIRSAQDAELFVFYGHDRDEMSRQVEHFLSVASRLSMSELTDAAAYFALRADKAAAPVRAAVVARRPAELTEKLRALLERLSDDEWLGGDASDENGMRVDDIVFGSVERAPRIGFLFPGQAAPAHLDGGHWYKRFESYRGIVDACDLPRDGDGVATEIAQPAIVAASCAALSVLGRLGIEAAVAIGHSLGELTALHWGGAFDAHALIHLAKVRGRAMADLGSPAGAMAFIAADEDVVADLLAGSTAVIAGFNGPRQTVISGDRRIVEAIVESAKKAAFAARLLPVSRAFHSPLVAKAAAPLENFLRANPPGPVSRSVYSTVTGRRLGEEEDVKDILIRQVTSPVRFAETVSVARDEVDLWIEVGPGQTLSTMMRSLVGTPVLSTDAGSSSLSALLTTVGTAYAMGAPVKVSRLFADRFTRPFDPDRPLTFLENPCEAAPRRTERQREVTHGQAAASTNGRSEKAGEVRTSELPPGGGATPAESDARPGTSPTGIAVASMDGNAEDAFALIRRIVADRAELPVEAVHAHHRLLSDLHLNSITATELILEICSQLALPPTLEPTAYIDATLSELATELEKLSESDNAIQTGERQAPAGVDSWVRAFTVDLVDLSCPAAKRRRGAESSWHIYADEAHPLADPLRSALAEVPGRGVAVVLPEDAEEQDLRLVLEGVHAVLRGTDEATFVLVQRGRGAASIARTLHLEYPAIAVSVVDVPFDHPAAAQWVAAEASAAHTYLEAHYDADGTRREPRLRLLEGAGERRTPLGPDDVVLVTGGAKGITAECVISLGTNTKAVFALIGRSRADRDDELRTNLQRMTERGINVRYFEADVTDRDAIRRVIRTVDSEIGPITVLLHGAARNVPKRLADLSAEDLRRTLAPKVDGLRNLLDTIDVRSLRLLIAFGSIISRIGVPGEGDYALANEWLSHEVAHLNERLPRCRCLTIDWSVWTGAGMGTRLGSVDLLEARGVVPITIEAGTALLEEILHPHSSSCVVATGRFGNPPTLRLESRDLPLLRFIERLRVHYPEIEVVAEASLSPDTDAYLDDHRVDGERLLPAVIGLEAIVQAAQATVGVERLPVLENVHFRRPIAVRGDRSFTIRTSALAHSDRSVQAVIRCESTAFQADHFAARCRFDVHPREELSAAPLTAAFSLRTSNGGKVDLNPQTDLYGTLLFHDGRFRRLECYHSLTSTSCSARIAAGGAESWFSDFLPSRLLLGDPAARDAAIHAIQACIPQATLIPVGVDRIVPGILLSSEVYIGDAVERSSTGDMFVYDLVIRDQNGRPVERWDGLRLQLLGEPQNRARRSAQIASSPLAQLPAS